MQYTYCKLLFKKPKKGVHLSLTVDRITAAQNLKWNSYV